MVFTRSVMLGWVGKTLTVARTVRAFFILQLDVEAEAGTPAQSWPVEGEHGARTKEGP